MLGENVNRGIILAAGDGDRLGCLTHACPKALLPLSSQEPLISYPIKALKAAGIKEIAVVVGYLGEQIIQSLGNGRQFGVRLQYVFNQDYLGGNAISAYMAREWAQGEPVVLCMGDHLIGERMVEKLLSSHTFGDTLCVDYTPVRHHQIEEATKVAVDSIGYIRNIGKEIADWDALDTGVFLLTERFFKAVEELFQRRNCDIETADVIRYLIGNGYLFHTCDVSGCFWMDVDTEEDLEMARL